ncbi:MAG: lipoyl synthase [Planctomycetes bacterium]|nr:lipoyl synthase [Planctomycetota bacterium]
MTSLQVDIPAKSGSTTDLVCHNLRTMAWPQAMEIQNRLLHEVQADPDSPARLLLVQHDPPVITTGRRPCDGQILAGREQLAREGIEIHAASRGGAVTYHGPGQLVGYPVVRLSGIGRTLRTYIHDLEEAIIRTLHHFKIEAQRLPGLTGAWVNGEKIAAIGVAVSRWVAYHGFALNVSPNLDHFGLIVPCGLTKGVTSMSKCLGCQVRIDDVATVLLESMQDVFGFARIRMADRETPPVNNASFASSSKPTSLKMPRGRLPQWLKKPLPAGSSGSSVQNLLAKLELSTICSSAKCPNIGECFARRTATFLILGNKCSRSCRFCGVGGRTGEKLPPPRPDEPQAVAEACEKLGLRHVVITSVTRDDLPDGGAAHFVATILAVRNRLGRAAIEVLTPDFQGRTDDLDTVLAANPDIFNHNVETVPRLHPDIRPQADYRRSLNVLKYVKTHRPDIHTKSGLMVGLGETLDEILEVMRDLRGAGCDMLTIGQYLPPSPVHAPVERFVEPAEFALLEDAGRIMGFAAVASGPFIRSSYMAEQLFRRDFCSDTAPAQCRE